MASNSDSPTSSNDYKSGSPAQSSRHVIKANGQVNGHLNGSHVPHNASSTDDEADDIPLSQNTQARRERSSPRQASSKKRKKAPSPQDSSSSDDDVPLASSSPIKPAARVRRVASNKTSTTRKKNGKPRKNSPPSEKESSDEDFEEEEKNDTNDATFRPGKRDTNDATFRSVKRMPNHKASATTKRPKKKVKKEESDDDDIPLMQSSSPVKVRKVDSPDRDEDNKPTLKRQVKKPTVKDEADSNSVSKAKRKSKATEEVAGSPVKKGRTKKDTEEGDADEVFKWWEQNPDGDGTDKWRTLEHNGVLFPPPYQPLPSNVKMKYDGKLISLPLASEEVAGFYAAMLETPHAQDAVFNKNFFEDWKSVLNEHPPLDGTQITSFNLCDFRPMYEHFEAEKAKKNALSSVEKKALKKAKDEAEAKYTTCLLDGRKEKIGNFKVEPPGLFRGRGDHPKKGALKLRVRPEDITLNIAEGAPIPVPNVPGKWAKIIHDRTVTWLANWTENVNGNFKYVFLAPGSSLKGQSDMVKFEKARELKNYVDSIRHEYTTDLKNKVMAERQRATAMYFIDRLALRAGNEKGEEEADTVGCCSLRCEHVTLEAPNFIIFDFLGKDSIRYYNRVPVDPQVFKNIRIFKENKNEDDNLFDRVTTGSLNKYLNSKMKGLTAKVFRTYNASITFQEQLDKNTPENSTVQEKLNAYNHANRMVAILCNHQRSVPKTHEQSMEKMRHKLRGFKYERMKLRHVLLGLDPKYKKNKKFVTPESDLDDDWIESYEEELLAKEIEKAKKKFAKDNEKLEQEGQKAHKDAVLKERIVDVEEGFKRLAEERGTGKATLKKERPPEKIEEQIEKLGDKIKAFKLQIQDRDAGKEVALGTSKLNYLDPRITAAWCKIHEVPIEKLFSKSLMVKFPWAFEVDDDWKF